MAKKTKAKEIEVTLSELESMQESDALPFIEEEEVKEAAVEKKENGWYEKVEKALISAEEGESVLINQYLPQSNDYMECKKIREEIQSAIAEKKLKVVANGHILLGTTGFIKETGKSFKHTVMNTPVYVKK